MNCNWALHDYKSQSIYLLCLPKYFTYSIFIHHSQVFLSPCSSKMFSNNPALSLLSTHFIVDWIKKSTNQESDLISLSVCLLCLKVIAVENNMKTPKSFGGNFGVLNVSMFVVTVLYAGMGLLGYWKYGNSEGGVKSSITLQEDGNLLYVLNFPFCFG